MEVNCESLSVFGATLANEGTCPTTEENVLSPHVVRDVLSLMHSCGMYNYSGQFAFQVDNKEMMRHIIWIDICMYVNDFIFIGWPARQVWSEWYSSGHCPKCCGIRSLLSSLGCNWKLCQVLSYIQIF